MDEDSVLCILYEAPLKNILSELIARKAKRLVCFSLMKNVY